ncbi:phenylalanine--tRNA ligase subunit beta, partial [Patescibacteria group bacterium]
LELKDDSPYVHPSRVASVIVDGEEVGKIFETHPIVLKNYSIDAKVAMFELNFTKLSTFEESAVKYKSIPKFPGLDIDISVLVDRKKAVAEIEKAIHQASEKLIKRIKLFDIYQGENIDDDKKALAFRVLLQAEDRTLTDEEMAKVQKKIFANLKNLGGVVRGV